MRQETRQNLVLRLSLSAEKQNGDKGRHYRALLTYWLNTFFENQCCRPERFRRYSVRPNIKGLIRGLRRIDDHGQEGSEGALSWNNPNSTLGVTVVKDGNTSTDIVFNAASCTAIYNDSVTTVKPDSLCILCLIRAYEV